MRAIKHTTSLLAVALLLTAPGTWAACDLGSIKGKFAGEYHFPEDARNRASSGALMLRFDGNGRITIIKGSEGSNGLYGTATGNGTYSLNSNCTGRGNLTIRAGGEVDSRGRFDFYVGGTKSNQEILGTYQSTDTSHTGSIRLIRSHL